MDDDERNRAGSDVAEDTTEDDAEMKPDPRLNNYLEEMEKPDDRLANTVFHKISDVISRKYSNK